MKISFYNGQWMLVSALEIIADFNLQAVSAHFFRHIPFMLFLYRLTNHQRTEMAAGCVQKKRIVESREETRPEKDHMQSLRLRLADPTH